MSIQERLEIFFRRLEAAPPSTTAKEAMDLVCRTIEQVEDEFCDLPRVAEPPLVFSGRMYAPQLDRIRQLPHGQLVANTRHHRIYCHQDGQILIEYVPLRKLVFIKYGKKK